MNAYLFSWFNGVIMPEPVLTYPQWKDWASASLPSSPPSPSPSLRSLMLQLNHALSNPEVAGHAEILIIFWKAARNTSILMCISTPTGLAPVLGAALSQPQQWCCWCWAPSPCALPSCPMALSSHSSGSCSPHWWHHCHVLGTEAMWLLLAATCNQYPLSSPL